MYQTSQDNCCLAAKSHLTLCDLMDCSPQDDSVGFPRQEYGNGLPFPCPGDLPDPGIESESPAWQADSLSLSHPGSPKKPTYLNFNLGLHSVNSQEMSGHSPVSLKFPRI